jgi:D-xylose 1-dehydrogenase (NADP+, D-xylono-1,5-lactone-forming)
MKNLLRWGIISTARINRRIIPRIKEASRSELLAVGGRDPEQTRKFADRWEIARRYASYDALLDDPDINTVYIPLPNSMHCEWVIRAARAGKNILCEKPLGLSVAEIDQMVVAAHENGVVLLEAMAYRMHPQYLRLKELLDDDFIGKIHLIRGQFCFTLPEGNGNIRWSEELGGGVLRDVGCYPISFARAVAGSLPIEVSACQVKGLTGVDIISACQLLFPGGVIAELDCSFVLPFGVRAEVVGERGVLHLPNPWQPDIDGKSSGLIHIAPDDTETIIPTRVVDPYLCEIEAMEKAVLDRELLEYSLSESRDNAEIIAECYRLARPVNVGRGVKKLKVPKVP